MATRDLLLYLFHAAFFLTFLPRVLERRRQAGGAAAEAPAPAALPNSARFSRGLIAFHAIAFFVLYLGINTALWNARIAQQAPLFPPQRLAGAVLLAAAIALSIWALASFRSWRIRAALTADHELATGGPFRFVRNPIYLAMDLLAVGSFLWVPRPLVALGALLLVVGCDLRARAEETLLLAAFGDRYRDYRRRVKRFVPGVY